MHDGNFQWFCDEFFGIFIDDFLVLETFWKCLENFTKFLKIYKETNLILIWEKCHFMVKEGIVLAHEVFSSGLVVDRVRIEEIEKWSSLQIFNDPKFFGAC